MFTLLEISILAIITRIDKYRDPTKVFFKRKNPIVSDFQDHELQNQSHSSNVASRLKSLLFQPLHCHV